MSTMAAAPSLSDSVDSGHVSGSQSVSPVQSRLPKSIEMANISVSSAIDTASEISIGMPTKCEEDVVDAPWRITPIDLEFQNIGYSVMTCRQYRIVRKEILKGVSGEFRGGQLSAVMGPSGAGKSSLLDVLSGYTQRGVTGQLVVGGRVRRPGAFRRLAVYLQQEPALHPELTVAENMSVAAALKLGRIDKKVKKSTVERVLKSLGLKEHTPTPAGRLSGGQQKRLAVALELLSDPPLMFFDEPTSGLDSVSSRQLLLLLRDLARQGRTVVCTVHQPSAALFMLFDQLHLLADGRCAYRGSTSNLVPYFDRLGLRCPPYHNPADFALEVAGDDYGDHKEALVTASDNGRRTDWTDFSNEDNASLRGLGTADSGSTASTTSWTAVYPTTFSTQLYILLKRTFKRSIRDKILSQLRLYIHLAFGIIVGLLFLNIGGEASNVFDNFGLLYFSLMFLMFTTLSAMMIVFPTEMPIIAREHFNRWYSLKSYFVAVNLADAPFQLVCTLVYTGIVYYLTGQPLEPLRFFLFLGMCYLASFVAQGIGLIIGAGLDFKYGVIVGPLSVLPATVFSGYFVLVRDAPSALWWLFELSFLKHALSGSVIAIYGWGRKRLQCTAPYCHFRIPEQFLREIGLHEANYWRDALVLVAIGFALRILAYFALWGKLRRFW